MAARFVSGTLLKTVEKGGKAITVQVVDKTTAWIRPSNYPITRVAEEFAEIVEENMETLDPRTTSVAMKESEHPSDGDKQLHYTCYELNSENKVVKTVHYHKKKT